MATCKNSKSTQTIEVGILEIRRHVPILYTFSKICKTKNTNVTIFTTKELFSRLDTYLKDENNYNFVIKEGNESNRRFLKRVETICNKKIDLLFVNTIHETISDLLYYLSFNPRPKTVLVVHHANAWLKPKLVLNINHMLRTIDTNLSSVLISKFVFPKFDAIDVIYSPVREHILKNMEYDKEIFTLPTSIFEDKKVIKKQKDDGILRVVIPGLIQEHRKDFKIVIPAFENLFKRFKEKLSLCVLGMPVGRYGKLIHEEFKEMKNKGYKVVIFDSFVPDDTFDMILNESDIILTPIRIKTRADSDIEEEYGKTVGSGVIYNAIQYAKPILVPAEFNMLKELGSSTLKYENSKELVTLIDELISNPEKLKKLKTEAPKNAQKFSLKKFQEYFEKNVLSWLQKN